MRPRIIATADILMGKYNRELAPFFAYLSALAAERKAKVRSK